jgi:hypothetical protein
MRCRSSPNYKENGVEALATADVSTEKNDHLPFSIPLEITITDPEVIAELFTRAEGRDRDDYALAAIRLGVLALRQARGQVDVQALKRASDSLLRDLEHSLQTHRIEIGHTLSTTLKQYFDPASGLFHERVERLLRKDGDLELLIGRKITADDSDMARVLKQHLGSDSPIFRLLSPTDAESVVAAIRQCVTTELEVQRTIVLREFSLDNQDGALWRLVNQLCEHNGTLEKNVQDKIDALLKQFSFDDDQSALSRMSRTVAEAGRTISSHLTLDDKDSALSRLRSELLEVLEKHASSAMDFQQSVRETLKEMQVRRQETAASTRHGLVFQDQVYEAVQSESQRLGDIASFVGNTVGRISSCKVGDVVVELGPETPAPGARIAIEAKEEKAYSVADARSEIDRARANRDGDAGIFVFSKKTAPAGIEPLTRHGQDIFVVWDADDSATDLYLKFGLSVARALCIKRATARESQSADFAEIDKAVLEINKQIEELEKVRGWATSIKKNSEDILERVRISKDKLQKQVTTLTERLADLRIAMDSTCSNI